MSVEKRWQLRIEHILEAIGKIQTYTSDSRHAEKGRVQWRGRQVCDAVFSELATIAKFAKAPRRAEAGAARVREAI